MTVLLSSRPRGNVLTTGGDALPPPPPPVGEDGVNELTNSKWTGADPVPDWAQRFAGEGTVTLSAGTVAEHQRARFAGTGGNRSGYEQDLAIVAGEESAISAYVTAIDDTTDSASPILNHIPFAAAELVSARPTLGGASVGRVHYIFRALETRVIKVAFGYLGSGADTGGDITLERPMADQASALRDYVATDPAPAPPDGGLDWDFIPNRGYHEGNVKGPAAYNLSKRKRYNNQLSAHRVTIRRSGTIAVVQHQVASNRSGESSKSQLGGATPHSFPASWAMRFEVYAATPSWQPDGPALITKDYTYTNSNGGSGGPTSNNSRVLMEHTINLPVMAGDRLLLTSENRESSPVGNHPSDNMCAQGGRPALDSNPPAAVGLGPMFGNDPLYVAGPSYAPDSEMLFGIGLRYTDGYEEGDVAFDSSPGTYRKLIGGNNRVRQTFSNQYWRRFSQIVLGAYRLPGTAPADDLTVQLSGADISTVTLDIAPTDIQIWDELRNSTYVRTFQTFALPSTITLRPSTTYTVELYSTGSSANPFKVSCTRGNYANGVSRAVNTSAGDYPAAGWVELGDAGGTSAITPHRWSGTAQHSSNGGSSWDVIGFPGGGADLPLGLFINRNMASTEAGLS